MPCCHVPAIELQHGSGLSPVRLPLYKIVGALGLRAPMMGREYSKNHVFIDRIMGWIPVQGDCGRVKKFFFLPPLSPTVFPRTFCCPAPAFFQTHLTF